MRDTYPGAVVLPLEQKKGGSGEIRVMQKTVIFLDGKVTTSEQLTLQANTNAWVALAATGFVATNAPAQWNALASVSYGDVGVVLGTED